MSDLPKIGDRIRLIEMPMDPDPVPPGSEGEVTYVSSSFADKSRQVMVDWDASVGRSLALIWPVDQFTIIEKDSN